MFSDDTVKMFDTRKKYSKDYMGGIEIETCVKTQFIITNGDPNWEFNIDFSKIEPYEDTEDGSIKCDWGTGSAELVTKDPYPIVDILDGRTKIGGATKYILTEVANACRATANGTVTCGTHVHMSKRGFKSPAMLNEELWEDTGENWHFEKIIRYMWIQYFQPYCMARFYQHQDRNFNKYAELSTSYVLGKYEMLNIMPSFLDEDGNEAEYDQSDWHFEFRGYGEMMNHWANGRAKDYMKILMNLWDCSIELYNKLDLKNSPKVKIEYMKDEKVYDIDNIEVLEKLCYVRKKISDYAPNYIVNNGTETPRQFKLSDFGVGDYANAIYGFNKDSGINEGAAMTRAKLFPLYKLRFQYVKKIRSNSSGMKTIVRNRAYVAPAFCIHVKMEPALVLLMDNLDYDLMEDTLCCIWDPLDYHPDDIQRESFSTLRGIYRFNYTNRRGEITDKLYAIADELGSMYMEADSDWIDEALNDVEPLGLKEGKLYYEVSMVDDSNMLLYVGYEKEVYVWNDDLIEETLTPRVSASTQVRSESRYKLKF